MTRRAVLCGAAVLAALGCGDRSDRKAPAQASTAVPSEEADDLAAAVNALRLYGHVMVMKAAREFDEVEQVIRHARAASDEIEAAHVVVSLEMRVSAGDAAPVPIVVKGIDPGAAPRVIGLGEVLVQGSVAALGSGAPGILIGRGLAQRLGVEVGGRVSLSLPEGQGGAPDPWGLAEPAPPPSGHWELPVVGIFFVDVPEHDEQLTFVRLSWAREQLAAADPIVSVELKVREPARAGAVAAAVERALGGNPYYVWDWRRLTHLPAD